ncbi:hypothetical protein GOP47_0025618 [Adiantum capillus-veneris]|uniref:BHLH domain-containing protein n=1 Tax=Adiantum capillus-veneris TaxID=13818 RepID=A0A9D4U0N5_ADICA|nr:hypothetical protein GOP47_0025618 [Adiantum capillus-veneris]
MSSSSLATKDSSKMHEFCSCLEPSCLNIGLQGLQQKEMKRYKLPRASCARLREAMDSCNSWSPKSLSPEALPPLDLILPSMAEERARGFCTDHCDEDASHLVTSTRSGNSPVHDRSSGSAKAVPEETFSLPSPSESTDRCTLTIAKRPKVDQCEAASKAQASQSQVPKLGEKITALQQLVAPFGKTDTASVLLEAIGYIKFLQEQVNVLSSPYMTANATNKEGIDLRSRGLCLVPISCTMNVANSNGADYWISGISGCSR